MSDAATTLSSAAVEHLRWSLTPGVGPILFRRLVEHFGSAQAALGASANALKNVEGIGDTLAPQIARGRETAPVAAEVELAARHNVRILCQEDEDYPAPLRHIPDPPICLYVRGRLEPADTVAVAIVGSRRCTTYGREQAYRFGYQLAAQGMTVISGLARGVDSESHKGAIAAGGRTIAVLGNGLADIYPPEHRELADRICECGAVVSELPMATSPNKANFLPRNRIIAGLSLGVMVVEAARRSGSLTTARLATEYNREVFALPGRVDSEFSSGTNALIRDGHARLVTCAQDVLDELGDVGEALGKVKAESDAPLSEAAAPARVLTLTNDERRVWQVLEPAEQSIEAIAEKSGLPAAQVAARLITLQLKGLARQLPGNRFVKVRS